MVNSKTKDDNDSDDDKQEAWRDAMQFDRRRIQQEPSPEGGDSPEDDEAEPEDESDWECAKCGYGKDAYGMEELNEIYETAGAQEIHYGCRRNG